MTAVEGHAFKYAQPYAWGGAALEASLRLAAFTEEPDGFTDYRVGDTVSFIDDHGYDQEGTVIVVPTPEGKDRYGHKYGAWTSSQDGFYLGVDYCDGKRIIDDTQGLRLEVAV